MPRPFHDPYELAVAERHRRRVRRALRHTIVMAAALLLVCIIGIIAAGAAFGRWPLPWPLSGVVNAPDRSGCQPPMISPAAPADTSVQVFNGTSRAGLATDVANELRNRGFDVSSVGNARSQDEASTVRFQPELEAEALAIASQLDDPVLNPSPSTTGIVLTLGSDYERLRDPGSAAEQLEVPQPSPVGCVDEPGDTDARQSGESAWRWLTAAPETLLVVQAPRSGNSS